MSKHSNPPTPTVPTETIGRPAPALEGCILRVLGGVDAGRTLDLPSGVAEIGARRRSHLRLSDPTVSTRHAQIEIVAEGVKVTDLGSTNGTFYLGTRVEEAVLVHGAVLTFGETRVVIGSRKPAGDPAYSDRGSYGRIIGAAPSMCRLYAMLERIETIDYTVLIQGETGVGKELAAEEIHAHSQRASGPFEIFDCTSVPQNLAESALFGHVRGSFTGAELNHIGVFERAHGGTVLLDEIGELPLDQQPKLLRLLDTNQVRPVGSSKTRDVDARVVAATNRNLADEVRAGRFREDLFFRLNVVVLPIPPLRQRREDISLLVRHFLAQLNRSDVELSTNTMESLTSAYDWPGNARELRNAIARVVSVGVLPKGIDGLEETEAEQTRPQPGVAISAAQPFRIAKRALLAGFESDYLANQLRKSNNNLSEAARRSGMDRNYFRKLLRKHGLK